MAQGNGGPFSIIEFCWYDSDGDHIFETIMDPSIGFQPLLRLPPGIDALRIEAASVGFRFIEKLVSEWESQANRFDRPGEMLAGAFQNAQLVAAGGLNIDPYANDPSIARIRHLSY